MKRVLTAGVLIPLVLLAVLGAPAWLFSLLVGGVALLATQEYLKIVEAHGLKPRRGWIYFLVTLVFASAAYNTAARDFLHPPSLDAFPTIFLLGSLLLLVLGTRHSDLRQALPGVAASSFGMLYVTWPLLLMVEKVVQADLVEKVMPSAAVISAGRREVLFLLVLVWASDTFAYYGGRLFGSHALAPRISPKKTWEGAAASIVGSSLVALSFWFFETYREGGLLPLWYWITFSVVLNVAAQFGDLVESLMKRGAGMKDSGSVLPGHGGMLDRIDGLLFASVALWYYPFFFSWIGNFPGRP